MALGDQNPGRGELQPSFGDFQRQGPAAALQSLQRPAQIKLLGPSAMGVDSEKDRADRQAYGKDAPAAGRAPEAGAS